MSAAFDYLGRVVMLVLAGMVTLSIIGAIASIPSGSIGNRIGFERGEPLPLPDGTGEDAALDTANAPEENLTGTGSQISTQILPAKPKEREPADWLEAITYALIALVGLVALGCVLLWRSLSQQSRIADALEQLAGRRDLT